MNTQLLTRSLTADQLLSMGPKLHEWPTGEAHSHGLSDHVLRFIDQHLRDGMVTVETGAGLSTIIFAARNARHTCIVPDEKQVHRIKTFCAENQISTAHVTFHINFSQNVLPNLSTDPIDMALVDGSHSFPVAFVDYFFIASRLAVGGILIIDNTNLWTGEVLRQFLFAEPGWTCVEDFPITVVFRKTGSADLDKDWPDQPYVRRRTYYLIARGKFRVALRHLRRGEFWLFAKKTMQHLLFRNPSLVRRAR